ncbi:MAG TPA: hypothetical protein VNA29_06400 [Sphingomicrobium sp.]|nr:hypothetical protein [Sphingomicrobium sp.]
MRQIYPALILLLTACSREEQPEAPTAAEAEHLNDAEAMLDELANEEGPASEDADPSSRSD